MKGEERNPSQGSFLGRDGGVEGDHAFVDPRCDAATFRARTMSWTSPIASPRHEISCACYSLLFTNFLGDPERTLELARECFAISESYAEDEPDDDSRGCAKPSLTEKMLRERGVVCDSYEFFRFGMGADHTLEYWAWDSVMPGAMPLGSFALLAMGRGTEPGHMVALHRSTEGQLSIFCPQSKTYVEQENIRDYLIHSDAAVANAILLRRILPPGCAPAPSARDERDGASTRSIRAPASRVGGSARGPFTHQTDGLPGTSVPLPAPYDGPAPRVLGGTVYDVSRLEDAMEKGVQEALSASLRKGQTRVYQHALVAFLTPWEIAAPGSEQTNLDAQEAHRATPRSPSPRDIGIYLESITGTKIVPLVFYRQRWSAVDGWPRGRHEYVYDVLRHIEPDTYGLACLYRVGRPSPLPATIAHGDGSIFMIVLDDDGTTKTFTFAPDVINKALSDRSVCFGVLFVEHTPPAA